MQLSNHNFFQIIFLKNYFLSNDPIDNSWAIYLLTGKSNKRFISGRYLKNLFSQIYEYPQWLIDTCYLKVGDSAEVITLLLKNKSTFRKKELSNISLNALRRPYKIGRFNSKISITPPIL